MPSEIEIYGDIVMFGLRITFQSNDESALGNVLALYGDWKDAERRNGSIYIVLRSYGVNPSLEDRHDVVGPLLSIARDGIWVHGNGDVGRGVCEFPCGTGASGALADLVNTMVLFLAGHAGRVPLHASAIMLGDSAIVFSGRSGAGKSTLALTAALAGLPVLSDDTIYLQTEPVFRLWSLAGPIHVFEKDAPPGAAGGMRLRGGRLKKSVANNAPCHSADRAILCVLARGTHCALELMPPEEAIAALTGAPEPGYQFYGVKSEMAARALAQGGAWRLTLSADPAQALALIREKFGGGATGLSFYRRYAALVSQIEARFPVAQWKSGDVDLWPLARFDLYLDMYGENLGIAPPRPRPWVMRFAGRLAKPLLNLWRSRDDLAHWRARPAPAPVLFLGDGVSLDRIDGVYRDRCGEPVISMLEKHGYAVSVMQSGELGRLPWGRPTFSANLAEAWGWLIAGLLMRPLTLPGHAAVVSFLAEAGVAAPSLRTKTLARRAALVAAAAYFFELLLKRVRPKLALVVTYYAGLGPAFVQACRRQGVFCVDLQHAPLAGAPMAYAFATHPANGYSTLPDLFWCWNEQEAARIAGHPVFVGGHPQLTAFRDDGNETTRAWDDRYPGEFEREILVTLQPMGGYRAIWEALAAEIEAAPASWRWWIRRHPASQPSQDEEFGRLLRLSGPNIMIAAASEFPLPALLRRASVLVSLASGAAIEAGLFGVPALFLSEDARGPFGDLLERGQAVIVTPQSVRTQIAHLAKRPACSGHAAMPSLDFAVRDVEARAHLASLTL